MADLLSVALHLPSTLNCDGKYSQKSACDSPKLTRSSSSENDTAVNTFGINCGKKIVDVEFQDLSYTIPGGIGKSKYESDVLSTIVLNLSPEYKLIDLLHGGYILSRLLIYYAGR